MTASWRTLGSTAGWGVFGAASWTWCIGMFLPILLIDRFGWWGFVAFAGPNVIGCAAFGYVVRDRARSGRLVAAHRSAMRSFSTVTIAYHTFFMVMLCWFLLPAEVEQFRLVAMIAPAAMLSVGAVLSNLPDRYWPPLALLVYAVSIAVFISLGLSPLTEVPWTGRIETINLLWLAPTLIFGFLLCPYLDLTFHRAIQHSPSRHAFSVFGIAFLVMIILTVAYWDMLDTGVQWAVIVHITLQSCLTVAAHIRELRCSDTGHTVGSTVPASAPGSSGLISLTRSWIALVFLTLLAVPLAIAGEFLGEPRSTALDMYVRFLVFYGLLFPLYVLIFMTGRRPINRTWQRWVAVAAVIAPSSAAYEFGFVHHQYHLLPLPLAVFLIWRLYLKLRAAGEFESSQSGSA